MKNQVKRLAGKGWFTKPLLVIKTKSRNSRLVGKVLKQYKGSMSAKEGVRLKRLINSYSIYLEEAGIPVIQTRCVLTPTKKGLYNINQVQPQVPQEVILSNYLSKCNREEAMDTFRQLMQIVKKLETFNKTHKQKIGLGPKPSNFAVIEGKVTLIDLYPPQVKDGDELRVNDILDRLQNKFIKKVSTVLEAPARRIVKREIDKHWSTEKLRERIIWHYSKRRPELKSEFR
jgi:hypothetical protein